MPRNQLQPSIQGKRSQGPGIGKSIRLQEKRRRLQGKMKFSNTSKELSQNLPESSVPQHFHKRARIFGSVVNKNVSDKATSENVSNNPDTE
ncbi:hypothetical protein RUND412_010182, partial [Rhizina undulata]